MYGVPNDLDLTVFRGATLNQVCLGMYQIQFHFDPAGYLSVEGGYELIDPSGTRIDHRQDFPRASPFELHRLLGDQVEETEVSAPTSIAFRFRRGYVLRVFDDSQEFESFQLQPGDIIV